MPDVTKQLSLPAQGNYRGIVATLKLVAAVDQDGTGYVSSTSVDIAGESTTAPDNSGLITFTGVVANSLITPANTAYKLVVRFPDKSTTTEWIDVPNGAGPYSVADILTTEPSDLPPPGATNADLGGVLTGTVGAAAYVADSVTTAAIAPDAITATEIADDAVTAEAIAEDAVGSAQIADDAVGLAAVNPDVLNRTNHTGQIGSETTNDLRSITGDGVADDRSHLVTALATPTRRLWFPPSADVRVSKYVPATSVADTVIDGTGAAVLYPSSDPAVVDDATTQSNSEARSAFLVMGGTRATFRDLLFQGDSVEDDINVNVGSGVYARTTTDLRLINATSLYGAGLLQQDANATDVGARVIGCTTYGWRGNMTIGNDAIIALSRWEQPVTATYDRIGTDGSSHGIYIFAGRRNTLTLGNVYKNVRTSAVKFSGSSLPVRNSMVVGSIMDECGNGVTWGDDTTSMPFHTNAMFAALLMHNPSTARAGWNHEGGIYALGGKGLTVSAVGMYFDRDNNGTPGSVAAVDIKRYSTTSSAVEGVNVTGLNMFTQIGSQTGNATRTVTATTVSASTTLTVTSGTLTDTDLGLALSGTNIAASAKIAEVLSSTSCRMSAAATGSGSGITVTITTGASTPSQVVTSAVRLQNIGEGTTRAHGGVRVGESVFTSTGASAISATRVVAPVIENLLIQDTPTAMILTGCRTPIVRNCTLVAGPSTSTSAQIRLTDCAWPIIYGLHTTNRIDQGLGGQSFSIGDNAGGSTAVDFPLLGASGRVTVAAGRPEVVMAFGSPSAWTNGDTVKINGSTVGTYKSSSPGANEFTTMAQLITLINAFGGGFWTAADYGAPWSITTTHLRVRRTTATTSAFSMQVTCANPTAGMLLCNGTGSNQLLCNSLGGEAAGPGTKLVIWSPLATDRGRLTLEAANSAAATLLATNGWYISNRGGNDSGTAYVVEVGTVAGTEEFRWAITP